MRTSDAYTLATAIVLCAAPVTLASVVNVFWEQNGAAWDLFASVTADTVIYNADLGDETIDLPPDGLNTGLFSTKGEILEDSFVTLGGEPVDYARPLTVSPSGSGSHADASWYNIDGVGPEFDPKTGYRIWLGRFFTEEGTTLGGAFGGPNGDTQSRIYIGWLDDIEVGLNVFEIPIITCNSPHHVPLEFSTIQAAIDCAVDGDEVIVAPGTYPETINFLGKAITVRSTDPSDPAVVASTIIDGQQSGSVVTCASGEGPDTVIDGFTITGGAGLGGGGMYIDFSGPLVRNCIFMGNSADWGAGLFNVISFAIVTDCTFIGNNASSYGGGLANYSGQPTIINCEFRNNSAPLGGAMDNWTGSVMVTGCTFDDNTANAGGGMSSDNINLTVTSCTFTQNTAGVGGGMYCVDMFSSSVSDSIFCENTPDHIFGDCGDVSGNCFADTCDDANGNGVPDDCECTGDIDGDGNVGAKDLLILLGAWGTCPPKGDCPADFDDSGDVGVPDLLGLLGNWGVCP